MEQPACVFSCPELLLLLLLDSLCQSLPALPLPRTGVASTAFRSRSS